MELDTFQANAPDVQSRQAPSLHEAAWPDMLANLQVAYAELTRTQLENEQRSEAERQDLNKQLVAVSRLAGMADVAASVLHNIGNVLNSVNVTASLVVNTLRKSPVGDIGRIATMLHEHTDALGDYLTHDPKGRQIPGYLTTLADYLTQEQATILKELEALNSKIDHIRQVISRQQDMARVGGGREPVGPGELMEEALAMNLAALERHQIEVVREYAEVPQIITDKHQVLQILVNFINNARQAMQGWNGPQHRVTLRVSPLENRDGWVRLQVQDTGMGIAPEHLPRLFTQGFTTKKDGHGLGLHSSVLAARQLEGSLSAHSAGEGQGATFTLDLPARPGEEHR